MKKRLYELDYIKIIAMLAVFTVHYTVEMQYRGVVSLAPVFPTYIFNTYLGSFGVSLFFIVSGAALMYTYGERLKPGQYLKKRFFGIYPMFWMAYIISFCFHFIQNRGIDATIPKWKLIYSVLGIDGTALFFGSNFYQLGEWFLGVLICLYLIFPIIRAGLNKVPLITAAAVLVTYICTVLFFRTALPTNCFFLLRIPELFLGMLYIKYRKKFGLITAVIGAAAVAIITAVPIDNISTYIQEPVVGMGAFLVLTYVLAKLPEFTIGKNLCSWASKYCYPFFLTHHVIICEIENLFTGKTLGRWETWTLYLTCFLLTLLFTKGLYVLHAKVMGFLNIGKPQR